MMMMMMIDDDDDDDDGLSGLVFFSGGLGGFKAAARIIRDKPTSNIPEVAQTMKMVYSIDNMFADWQVLQIWKRKRKHWGHYTDKGSRGPICR
jgi:hypothetical protein